MKFVEICDFIVNSQEIKFINFSFTSNQSSSKSGKQKALELYEINIQRIEQMANSTQVRSLTVFGEGTITILLKDYEPIVIKKATHLEVFQQLKNSIMSQLNDSKTIN